jgi:expansin (peptidoglycan-binding protein)
MKKVYVVLLLSSVCIALIVTSLSAQTPVNICTNATVFTGKSTWYELGGGLGHCSFPTGTLPKYFAAMNGDDYAKAAVCGSCVEISVPGSGKAPIIVYIADECPYQGNEQWCYPGSHHIDLCPAAFEYFADKAQGVIPVIEWKYVPCSVAGSLTYAYKDQSSIWWSAVMIRNSQLPVKLVEYMTPTKSWKTLTHTDYNYWLDDAGFGEGPYSFRITNAKGDVVEAKNVPGLSSSGVPSVVENSLNVQFPGCSNSNGIKGDVNGDGKPDIVDALQIAQYYVGLSPANFNTGLADFNGDGAIDIVDALRVAQYYVGL